MNKEIQTRSELERIRLKKERLKFVKELRRIDRKWNLIWGGTIITYIVLGFVFLFIGWNNALFGMILGIILSGVFWNNHRLDIKDQMEKVERMRELDKRIVEEIKKQEYLEKKF